MPETFPEIKVPIILNNPIKVRPVAAIVVSKPKKIEEYISKRIKVPWFKCKFRNF